MKVGSSNGRNKFSSLRPKLGEIGTKKIFHSSLKIKDYDFRNSFARRSQIKVDKNSENLENLI